MTKDLVLHDRTRHDIEGFLSRPRHSLLLVGAPGSGKRTLAQALAAQLLQVSYEKLATYPYYAHIHPEKGSISIEAIRRLQDFVRLKTTGDKAVRRAVVVKDAHLMTIEAQNAFLKLLEEPPRDTVLILTAQGNASLLPTIVSRAPKITVKTPSQQAATEHFAKRGFAPSEITKSYYISRGQIGLMHQLLHSDNSDERLQYIDDAKQLLRASVFERLVWIDQFNKQKKDLPQLLWALQRVADAALRQAAQKGAIKQVERWRNALEAIVQAQDDLSANPQTKLLLMSLSLQF